MLRSLLKSTASNVFKFMVSTGITLVMTPVYIHELGNYDYGIWEIMISVVGYLGLLDIGLRPTISRFIAYYRTSKDPKDQQSIFTTTLCLMAIVGCIISMFFLLWSVIAPNILSPDPETASRYALVLQIFALHVLFSFPFYALESTFEGNLNYTTKNNIAIGHSIIGAFILYNLLPVYDPLVFLTSVNVGMAVSKFLIFYALLNTKSYGGYRFHIRSFDSGLVVRLLRFGGKAMTQGIASIISKRSMPLIIGFFLGPQKIVFYNLAFMLIERVSGVTRILSHAFMPAFSTMHSNGDQLGIERYFFTGTIYLYAIKAATCLGVGVIGSDFITLWIGPEYGEAARPLIWIMVLAELFRGMLPLHNRLLIALNYHGSLAILYMVRSFLHVLLTLALIVPFGLIGVVLANLLAQVMVVPFIWRAVFRHLNFTPLFHLRNNIGPALISAIAMALTVSVFTQLNGLESWFSLITSIIVGVVIFIPLFLFGVINSSDRAHLWSLWRRAFTK